MLTRFGGKQQYVAKESKRKEQIKAFGPEWK